MHLNLLTNVTFPTNNGQNQSIPNFCSKKIPRNLYHFTTDTNYKRIMESGEVGLGGNVLYGVFMVDLTNFFKAWTCSKTWNSTDLRRMLIKQVLKSPDDKLVLLRVPTKKIDLDKLLIRSQEVFFGIQKERTVPHERMLHYTCGIPATKAKHFKRKNEAIEYIYPEQISADCTEKVGEFEDKFHSNLQKTPLNEIFSGLLKGQPEEKALVMLSE